VTITRAYSNSTVWFEDINLISKKDGRDDIIITNEEV